MRNVRLLRLPLIATVLLLGVCSATRDGKNAPLPQSHRVSAATLRVAYPGPDDWHRLALYGNWDFIEKSAWREIVAQSDCDRATALAIFWKASPEYYAQFVDRSAVPAINRDDYDLIVLIRDRWQAGAYSRAELAFDPDVDAWPVDLDDLRQRYGDRVEQLMPPNMRVQLQGRRLSNANFKAPGVTG